MSSIEDIEDRLDKLQAAYIDEEDEVEQISLVRQFTILLKEATDLDGIDRVSAGITINNWTRENKNPL